MASLIDRIQVLKARRNALILAHYYQPGPIQDAADFVGDSLELSRKAQQSDADVIVFCGVSFMAESAKILSPRKTVLNPNPSAGCPMADMVTPADVRNLRARFPRAAVVTYINSTAAVKAESDICCTSANAAEIVRSLPNREIIFIPDQNLGQYVARFSSKTFHYFDGSCPIHHRYTAEQVMRARRRHPGVPVLVHPECPPPVVAMADFVGSTSRIIAHAVESNEQAFIIGTESGILHPLRIACPEKTFYRLAAHAVCPDMKKIGLRDVLNSLEQNQTVVLLDEQVRSRAAVALERMMAVR